MSSNPNNKNGNDGRKRNTPSDDDLHRDISLTFDEDTETYHVAVDPETEVPLTVTIVQAVADISQTDPLQLEPLTECIDPDSLERLYSPERYTSGTEPVVSFAYAGYQITVTSSTEIAISP